MHVNINVHCNINPGFLKFVATLEKLDRYNHVWDVIEKGNKLMQGNIKIEKRLNASI